MMRMLLICAACALLAAPADARPRLDYGCNAAGYHLIYVNGWPRWVKC